MAHAYTTKRGKNKKSKLGVRKDQQQNQERQLKHSPNLAAFLYDGPKDSAIGEIGRIGSSSSSAAARLENIKSRLQKSLTDKCSNPDCQNASDASTLSECAACHQVRYCCRDCQKAHWNQHKEACKAARKKKEQEEVESQQRVMQALQELGLQGSAETATATSVSEPEPVVSVFECANSGNVDEEESEDDGEDDDEEEEAEEEDINDIN